MAEKVEPPPTTTARDRLVEIASSAAGEFPLAGTVVEVLRQIFGTAYEHRREAWLRRLYELVVELDERGVDVDALAGRQAFVTAVHDASRIARGEHIEEKLDMLKAVLFNAATRVPDDVSDLWTLRYLRWVDELEPQHIAVLRFGLDPRSWLTEAGVDMPEFISGPRSEVLKLASFPFPVEQMELILEDLRAVGLGDAGSGMVTGRSLYGPWVTDRGRRFLEWLTVVRVRPWLMGSAPSDRPSGTVTFLFTDVEGSTGALGGRRRFDGRVASGARRDRSVLDRAERWLRVHHGGRRVLRCVRSGVRGRGGGAGGPTGSVGLGVAGSEAAGTDGSASRRGRRAGR